MDIKNLNYRSDPQPAPSGGDSGGFLVGNKNSSSLDAAGEVAAPQPWPQKCGEETATGNKRAKHRRNRRAKRRRWKPYYKLTAEERKALEVYEEKRAERIRAWRFKHGIPVAPYNTTQFLLNDRQNSESVNMKPVDDIVASIRCHTRSGSYESIGPTSSGSGGSSVDSEDDEDYSMMEQREFDEEYESAHTERLESMSKSDLIKDYIELEKELEHIQRELAKKSREIDEMRQLLATKKTDAIDSGV